MAKSFIFAPSNVNLSIGQRLAKVNWLIVLVICAIAGIGFATLYSVAGGSWEPWAKNQAIRFALAMILMLAIAVFDLRWWMTLAYPAFVLSLILLILVEFIGASGMGGQRWLDLGFMRLQPSEIVKVTSVMALACYFHGLTSAAYRQYRHLIIPVMLIVIPALLVVRQPDLGTAALLITGGLVVLFLAGARVWLFWIGGVSTLVSIPFILANLRDYQRERILTFLNPENDPLGAGYQIMQSKIALGSGGVFGKGFLQGTQSHLNFLPEMKTDFIFTVLAEEFGLVGGIVLISLYVILFLYALYVSQTCRSQFGRLLAGGLGFVVFLYVFINIGMVMGLLPVVGVPLPLVSWGGSSMLTVMVAFGLILSVAIHRDVNISRQAPLT